MKCSFYVDKGRWYFRHVELKSGADMLLDFIADGRKEIALEISTAPFKDADEIKYQNIGGEEDVNGAYYYVETYKGTRIDLVVHLDDAFIFLFRELPIPKRLYFKPL